MNKSIYTPTAWKQTLAIAFIAQFVTSIGFQLFVPFLPLYVRELGTSSGITAEFAAGFALASAGLAQMFSSALWGAIADRYGRKMMLLRATFGGMILLGLMGVVMTSEQLIALRLIQGFITGTVAATNALVAAVTPRERMGFAMSMLQVGLWAGLAVGPLVGGVISDLYGYHAPFFFTAVLLGMSGILLIFGIREKFTPITPKAEQVSMWQQWKHALVSDGIPIIFSMKFLTGLTRSMLIPVAALFVVSLLPTTETAHGSYVGMVSSISAVTATLGGVYFGRMGDTVGHRRMLLIGAMVGFVGYIPQMFVVNVWQLVLLQALTGFAFGGMVSALSAMLAMYSAHGEEGSIYGLDGSIGAASFAIAPVLGSALMALFGMQAVYGIVGLVYLIVFVMGYSLTKVKRPYYVSGD
jgi:MFS transporter, DHA1 family, multidrug resistance protein